MEEQHEFHDHPLTFFIWKNADQGIKEGSKRESLLKILLKHTDNDILLVKNKDGYSALDYILEKDRLKVNCSKKVDRTKMIETITLYKLRPKYLFMVLKSQALKKLSVNLKVVIAQQLA
mmetsp:Transcript_23004/g.25553  ORF Transcript_23004/g.25553 Transcript_23004/m.25553 type:complete len:119 (-) Transcript_23004:82-438(-)